MLMKYPPIADMQYFIDMARYLREPNVRSLINSLILSHTVVHTAYSSYYNVSVSAYLINFSSSYSKLMKF